MSISLFHNVSQQEQNNPKISAIYTVFERSIQISYEYNLVIKLYRSKVIAH